MTIVPRSGGSAWRSGYTSALMLNVAEKEASGLDRLFMEELIEHR